MTEIQDRFVQKVIDFATPTSDVDKHLVKGMEQINDYLKEIDAKISTQVINEDDFYLSANKSSTWMRFNGASINFVRKAEFIQVDSSNRLLDDKITVKANELSSETYGNKFSASLLDQYLSIVFGI